jgi:hypothetical protein
VKPCEVPLLLDSYQMVSFWQDYDAGLSRLAARLGLWVKPTEAEEHEKPQHIWSRLRLLPLLALVALPG